MGYFMKNTMVVVFQMTDTMRVVCGVAFMMHDKPKEGQKGADKKLEDMEQRLNIIH